MNYLNLIGDTAMISRGKCENLIILGCRRLLHTINGIIFILERCNDTSYLIKYRCSSTNAAERWTLWACHYRRTIWWVLLRRIHSDEEGIIGSFDLIDRSNVCTAEGWQMKVVKSRSRAYTFQKKRKTIA